MNSIWVHSLIYALLPVVCVVLGLFFVVASVMVGSKIGVVLSIAIGTYGTMILCWRHSS